MRHLASYPKRCASTAGRTVAVAFALAVLAVGCSSEEGESAAPMGSRSAAPGPEPEGDASPSEAAPATAEMRDFPLQVLMPNGEPANGARVRFIDTATISPASLLRATGGEPDADKILEVLGEEKITDREGMTTFQTSGGPLLASASLGQLFVAQPFAPLARDAEVLTLKLTADLSVRARALDRDGLALDGIPIALCFEVGLEGNQDVRSWIDLAVRETNGEDATVRFRDPRGGVGRMVGEGAPRFGVRAAIPGLADPSPIIFDPDAPPNEPIDIVVPPLSTFVVEVLSASGQLTDIDADVIIEAEARRGTSNQRDGAGSRLRARLRDGRATLHSVVPGTLLRVTVQPLDSTASFEGVGPSALKAGGTATLSVSIDD